MASSSSRIVLPFSEMPANAPRERDQDRISARIVASVSADVVRPTGPAAAIASPPTVNLLFSKSRFAPRSFITSITTSVSDPPIWKPTLPPSTLTAPGALHPPPALRQVTKPRPYFAPTINAPLLTPGTTIAHSALSNRSCGNRLILNVHNFLKYRPRFFQPVGMVGFRSAPPRAPSTAASANNF